MRVVLMSSHPSYSVLCSRYLYLILMIVCNILLHKCNARPLGLLSSTNPVTRISFHKGSDLRFMDTTGITEKDEDQWQYGFHKKAAHTDRAPAPAPVVDTSRVAEQVSRRTDMTKAKASAYDLESSKERLSAFDGGGGADEKLALKKAVSWQVPGKSQRQKHPGVYSDYPKPRPRPPTHN